ncbi:hypothetical protein LTS18_007031 [Coniosporium uncinatum]|uniref:Uncharacterized protein n=1 Tax=Coniosporium uncinatum TaxID=93489 RepID=A0ACC3D3G9_9PEZI|nr:hypothetical protein LTS18_007031 [Coniosporium uncinatum]
MATTGRRVSAFASLKHGRSASGANMTKETASGGAGGGGKKPNQSQYRPGHYAEESEQAQEDKQKRQHNRKVTPRTMQFTKEYLHERARERLEELEDDMNTREARILRRPIRGEGLLDWRDDDNDSFQTRPNYILPAQAHMRGDINRHECTHCAEDHGVLMDCVSLEGEWDGACTNCAWGGHQARCSHYSKRTT